MGHGPGYSSQLSAPWSSAYGTLVHLTLGRDICSRLWSQDTSILRTPDMTTPVILERLLLRDVSSTDTFWDAGGSKPVQGLVL